MSASATGAGRTYYPHIEGLRGVAALYVFIFHIWQTAIQHPATATLSGLLPWTPFLQFGHFAVAAFIVISGFCLGLPVAQRRAEDFRPLRFFARRARRLMPAYVAVVLLSVIPFCATGLLHGAHINPAHIALAVALHLALVHNLSFAATEYLNGPLWSIALECQIYVVFALLLVPAWRRFGLGAPLVLAAVAGFAPHFLTHSFDWTVPWLVVLFAFGVAAADICARPALPALPWNALAAGAAIVALAALVPYVDGEPDWYLWLPDLLVGAAFALFFVAAHRSERILPARVLSTRPLVFVGTFSYSLYLIHAPLVDFVGALLWRVHATAAVSAAAWLALIPLVIAAAYAFYRVFERPFLSAGFRRAIDADVQRTARAPHPAAFATEPAA